MIKDSRGDAKINASRHRAMVKDSRGDANLIMVSAFFIVFFVFFVGLMSSRLYAEYYQSHVKKEAISLEEATEALQLKSAIEALPIDQPSTHDVEVKSGDIKKVKVDPLFNTTKKVKEEFDFTNQQTNITLIDNPPLTKYNSVNNITVSSNRFAQYAWFQDSDGSSALNKKPTSGANSDRPEKMLGISQVKKYAGNLVSLENHPTSTSLDKNDSNLPRPASKVNLYLNGDLISSKKYNNDNVINFSAQLSALATDDIVSYEYFDSSNKIYAVANIQFSPSTKEPVTVYSNGTKMSESHQVVLSEGGVFQTDDSLSSNQKGATDIKVNADLYQNLKVSYYNELVCNYKEVITPIAYVDRNLGAGTDYPYTGTGAYGYDGFVPTKDHFKTTITGNPDSKTGSLDFDGDNAGATKPSPCANTALSKTTAYDGVFLWYHPLKKYQSFINGFNTIPQATLARFEGSRANGNGITFANTQTNINNQNQRDKYNYRYDTSVTNIPSKSKLYCSDYTIKNSSGTEVYPYIMKETEKWWQDRITEYETYIQAQLAAFNTQYQNVQWTNATTGSNLPLPVWDENKHSFDTWMKDPSRQYYKTVNGKQVADTRIPCITDIGRNGKHIQYKPRLDSFSEVNYNIINNVQSEYTVTLKGKINQNFIKEIENYRDNNYFYNPTSDPYTNAEKQRFLNSYSSLTELEAVKGWLEEYTTQRARVYIDAKDNSIYTKGDNTVDTSDGFYIELEPEKTNFNDIVNQNTGEVTLTYKFTLGPNYSNSSLKTLHEDVRNVKDFTQVRFYAYLGNTFFTNLTIESEVLDTAYYKLSSLSEDGKILREDFLEVSQ